MGTGYAWAGHKRVTLFNSFKSTVRDLSPKVSLGATLPTGSKISNQNFIFQESL